jgi:hypothetical protein
MPQLRLTMVVFLAGTALTGGLWAFVFLLSIAWR